jgi:N6-adenosine-specific RNA methylase IME4
MAADVVLTSKARAFIREVRAEKVEKMRIVRADKEAALAGKQRALPDKRYGVIYADPPWRFETWGDAGKTNTSADNHYPCMAPSEIMLLDVPSISADDAALYLWVTVPFERQGHDVMEAWGFRYVSQVMWKKDRIGTGYWYRNQHEVLLFGTRGNVPKPAPGTQWPSVIEAPIGEQSVKPDVIYEMIESYFPNLPKIELYARRARPGWDVWGLEAP